MVHPARTPGETNVGEQLRVADATESRPEAAPLYGEANSFRSQ